MVTVTVITDKAAVRVSLKGVRGVRDHPEGLPVLNLISGRIGTRKLTRPAPPPAHLGSDPVEGDPQSAQPAQPQLEVREHDVHPDGGGAALRTPPRAHTHTHTPGARANSGVGK